MKKKLATTTLALLFLIFASVYIFIQSQDYSLRSPILGISKNMLSDNIWMPKVDGALSSEQFPEVTSQAAFFIETQTGQVLYQKNINEKLSIASLNKIMAAIIALENRDLGDKLTVSQQAEAMEPDKMFLIAGEKLTIKELLDGVFLISANDATEVLAEKVTGKRDHFIYQMNLKAQQLGMNRTRFINPTGLEEDFDQQYSTAFDVAIMARYAISKHPKLLEISSQPYIYLEKTAEHQDYEMYTGINLLTTYPGVLGLKTGYTPKAGLTLVTVARREGKEVLGVLLNSTERRDDAKALLDYSFTKLGVSIP